MHTVAALLTAWVAWRWVGFVVGLVRVRRFEGPVRREARRTVIARGAWNMFFTVGSIYLWAAISRAQPNDTFVGFLAAVLVCSLAVGVIAGFMQPEVRTPATLSICRVRPIVEEESSADPQRQEAP